MLMERRKSVASPSQFTISWYLSKTRIKIPFELNLQMVYIEMVGLHMFYAMWSTRLDFGARLRASLSPFLSCTLAKVDQLAGLPSHITAYDSSFFASASRFFTFVVQVVLPGLVIGGK
jgi:hypothetical protein